MNLFKNNEPDNDVKPLVNLLNELIVKRMDEKDEDEEPMEVTKEEFDDTVTKFKKKNKRSDDFLIKASDKFQNPVFKLDQRVIQEEEIPERISETVLHHVVEKQIFHGRSQEPLLHPHKGLVTKVY